MIIEPASQESVQIVWPFVRDCAKKACEKVGVSKFEDLERNTLNGTDMAWLVREGQGIYGFVTITRCDNAFEIVQCIGTGIYRFLPLIGTLEQFARDNGATLMRLYGRKGWRRVLKDYHVAKEYPTYLIMEKTL